MGFPDCEAHAKGENGETHASADLGDHNHAFIDPTMEIATIVKSANLSKYSTLYI